MCHGCLSGCPPRARVYVCVCVVLTVWCPLCVVQNNKSVDMKTLLSVQLFASYWCRVLANAAISVVCITLIILTFMDGSANTPHHITSGRDAQ